MTNIFFKNNKIFNIYNKLKIKKNKENNNLGYIRQFPPANIEWSNSIYAYNKNYIKNLPSFDKMVNKVIKSYFYLHDEKKKKSRSRRMHIRLKRLSLNRIFVSKAEIKHTNTKAIVTLYIYNAEKRYLLNKLKKFKYFFSLYNIRLKRNIKLTRNRKVKINKKLKRNIKFKINKKLTRNRKVKINKKWTRYRKLKKNKKLKRNKKRPYNKSKRLLKLIKINTLIIKDLFANFVLKYLGWQLEKVKKKKRMRIKKKIDMILNQEYETVIKRFLKRYWRKEKLSMYYKYLLWFNKSKFENTYLYPLNKLIKNLYNKNIEFNIVNLKYLHLNSNILTESIAIKLRNRKNRLLKVLDFCLKKIKLPIFNKNSEMFSYVDKWEKKKLSLFFKVESLNLIDKLSTLKVSNVNNNLIENKDFLNQYLQEIFLQKKLKNKNYLVNTILNNIKRKTISGVRLEASGRLSRRFIASRSVFKVRYRGTIRNIDSSYKGLPNVILRGHLKSNLQYTNINSKTRIGSFGLKGWVSTL